MALVVLCALTQTTLAATDDLSGQWHGKLVVGSTELPLVVNLKKDGEKQKGSLDSPAQGVFGLLMDEVNFDAENVSFKINSISAYFEGQYDPKKEVVSGNFIQGGVNKLVLSRPQPADAKSVSKSNDVKDLEGTWSGQIKIPGSPLAFVIHISEVEGELQATADSPDQGATGLKVDKIMLKDGEINFNMVKLGVSYKGQLNQNLSEIEGKFSQGGMIFELNFSQEPIPEKVYERSQIPKAPFDYHIEEVVVQNQAAGIELAGTLTRPREAGEVKAAAVLITGSGPQDRDETIFEHKPFWVIADHFAKQGYAVLRLDDRGVGESSGNFNQATSEDFVTDVSAAVDFLQQRSDIPEDKIGLIGHSEGGMIAPMLASERDDLAYLILLAAPGVPVTDLMAEQKYLIAKSNGTDEVTAAAQRVKDLALNQSMVKWIAEGDLTAKLTAYFEAELSPQFESPEQVEQMVEKNVKLMDTPWFRYFIAFKPAQFLKRVKTPVLALNGEHDVQVAAASNLVGVEKALTKANNKDVTILSLPKLNHMFQTSSTGAISEYININETFSPVALDAMINWLDARF